MKTPLIHPSNSSNLIPYIEFGKKIKKYLQFYILHSFQLGEIKIEELNNFSFTQEKNKGEVKKRRIKE